MLTNILDDASTGSIDNEAPRPLPPSSLGAMDRPHRFGESDNARIDRDAIPPSRDLARLTVIPPLVEISPAETVSRRARIWTGMAAEFVQSTSRVKTEYRFRAPVHLLILYEQAARHDGETFVEGLPQSKLRDFTRRLTFVPAGHEYREWQEPRTLTRLMYFYLDPLNLPLHFDSRVANVTFAPRLFFGDAVLWDTALKLKRLVENPNSQDRPYCEAVGAVLTHELIRLNRPGSGVRLWVQGGLATWQQRLVPEYIEEHLAEQIPLATLARLVRLSPFHFSRAFKQSFGVPPHRYHTSRRIERAKAMLAKPEFSVTVIGLRLGFSETSSFTAAFRKATGITPTGYRRSLG